MEEGVLELLISCAIVCKAFVGSELPLVPHCWEENTSVLHYTASKEVTGQHVQPNNTTINNTRSISQNLTLRFVYILAACHHDNCITSPWIAVVIVRKYSWLPSMWMTTQESDRWFWNSGYTTYKYFENKDKTFQQKLTTSRDGPAKSTETRKEWKYKKTILVQKNCGKQRRDNYMCTSHFCIVRKADVA